MPFFRRRPARCAVDGTRSGFESDVRESIAKRGLSADYEARRVPYNVLHHYTPDFTLPNGVHIEAKGYFTPSDRTKLLMVREQHPGIDIRLLFMRASTRLNKRSKTTYAQWADKNGFRWAEGVHAPGEWWSTDKPPRSSPCD